MLLPDLLPHNQFPNILLWTAVTRCHRICVRSTLVHQNLHAAALLCKQDKQSCRCQCRGCAENHDERGFELGEKSTGNENPYSPYWTPHHTLQIEKCASMCARSSKLSICEQEDFVDVFAIFLKSICITIPIEPARSHASHAWSTEKETFFEAFRAL